MTLIFQNVSANSAGTSKSGATTGNASTESVTTAVVEGGAPVGSLSFSQLLGEGATSKTVLSTTDVTSLLEGLLQNASLQESTTTTEADVLNLILEGLNEQITELDELIEEDSSLMLTLQNWLQQVNELLSADQMETESVESDPNMVVSNTLADDSATIRFAVQDAVTQLISSLQNKVDTNNMNSQAVHLLASVQNLLQQVGSTKSQSSTVPVGEQAANNTAMLAATVSEFDQVDSLTVTSRKDLLNQLNVNQTSASMKVEQLIRSLQSTSQGSVVPQNIEDTATVVSTAIEENVAETSELTPEQGILTAGELAMRDGIKASKPVTTPVPVQQFSKEVTDLVVSKLDIVKLNGLTEAKISLYPEHLGQVDIKITMQNGQLIATFMTEHAGAKDLLEQQMSQLRTSLQSQGLQVEKLEVTQNQSLQSHMYQEERRQSNQQQSNRRSKERDAQSDDALLVANLSEELNDWLSEQVNGEQGNSFTAEA
ncbi:flagellar hook-length control protein FliK [Paenibacillus crassostreae]|uniref:Flagellar hook-length control protein-like C-terminal domain-containing protein n=1 Tax=Paenibacillus crassostreae TaxID=1763538 RepID=A0A167FNJ3_9BACL|nr:flagellar hook-length control protein FliK [Paenibacillus crassostreae]AOZ94223.1 hypothetical protein LPB68_19850 [Paenibacillus crassostreae]OAB76741.1 hypothetical protein PNBC_04890 [Paenibacillus crassostreae]